MSKAEVDRFVNDLKSNADLLGEVKNQGASIASVVELANSRGYDISLAEAKAYVQSQTKAELSDDELDSVAGGKGSHVGPSATNVVQTAETVTTVVAATAIVLT